MTPRRRLLSLIALGLAGALSWTALGTFSTASGQEAPIIIDRAHQGAHRPSFDQPIFFLIMGGDARSGNPERTRIDSIHILAIDPVAKRGSIVGIPRDSWVQSSQGYGERKITDLGFLEGRDGFIQTVENVSGCSFDYYMLTSFQGFAGPYWQNRDPKKNTIGGIINDLGGIRVKIPSPGLTDEYSLERQQPIPPGEQTLNGAQALAWSRSRHQLSLRPRGDFSRSQAQGDFMLDVLAEMKRDYKENPGTAMRNIAVVRHYVDLNIPIDEGLALGLMAMRLKPKRFKSIVVDGTTDTVNGASIVRITSAGRAQLVDVCADGLLNS